MQMEIDLTIIAQEIVDAILTLANAIPKIKKAVEARGEKKENINKTEATPKNKMNPHPHQSP